MSKISEFAGQVSTSFEKIQIGVDGIKGDVDALNAKITELQNSAGTVSPEDQALLDDVQAKAGALADKVAVLDAETTNVPAAPVDDSGTTNGTT